MNCRGRGWKGQDRSLHASGYEQQDGWCMGVRFWIGFCIDWSNVLAWAWRLSSRKLGWLDYGSFGNEAGSKYCSGQLGKIRIFSLSDTGRSN